MSWTPPPQTASNCVIAKKLLRESEAQMNITTLCIDLAKNIFIALIINQPFAFSGNDFFWLTKAILLLNLFLFAD
ncbi:MAG: hypothetical protein ACI9T7_002185 [Oleiphilaceae bacterium]|jgi:hypothetical protein